MAIGVTEVMSLLRFLTKPAVVVLPLFACASYADSEGQEGSATLEYTVTSFPDIIQREDDEGNIELPSERIPFGEAQKQIHIMTATVGDRVVNCPLAYQDAAYLLVKGETVLVPVIAFTGCPFVMPDSFESRDRETPNPIAFRDDVGLEIETVEGNVAYTTLDSDIPFIIVRGQVIPGVAAANTTWTFHDKGTRIQVEGGQFVTTADNATVKFQHDSVVVQEIAPVAGKTD